MKSRLIAKSVGVTATVAAAVTAFTPVASAASASAAINYVAMGDSYSAGSGVLPLAAGANPLCTQSAANSAHVIAAAKGFQLRDVTCGGATTADYSTKQFGVVAPQLDALSASTNLVTMTIGGNDSSVFLNMILACGSAGLATFGMGSPCKSIYGNSFNDTINTKTYPAVVNALKAVKAKAPNARIAIAGYPSVLPATRGCFPLMPIASGDLAYVNNIEATLNGAVQRAAAATGVTFVDMLGPTLGHDACQPIGTRWVEPAVGTLQYVPVHPNALGEKAYANQYIAKLGL